MLSQGLVKEPTCQRHEHFQCGQLSGKEEKFYPHPHPHLLHSVFFTNSKRKYVMIKISPNKTDPTQKNFFFFFFLSRFCVLFGNVSGLNGLRVWVFKMNFSPICPLCPCHRRAKPAASYFECVFQIQGSLYAPAHRLNIATRFSPPLPPFHHSSCRLCLFLTADVQTDFSGGILGSVILFV